MSYLKNGFKHFITICKHKSAVFYFGRKLHIGFRAFFHDLSKFHPIEFCEGVKYYSGTRSPIDACKELNGYSKAWMHHRDCNPHHYEYWIDNLDNGGIPIDMPPKYKLEMLADYLAAGYTYSNGACTFSDEYAWWLEKSKKPLCMHEKTKNFLDKIFEFLNNYFGSNSLKSLDEACWKIILDYIELLLKT